ncbi:MAG: hypothetical protein AB7Q23_16605 [Hyphomonadaceae bacterium]
MLVRIALVALALAVAGCDGQGGSQSAADQGPQLDAPGPEGEPAREFGAVNDAARAAAGANVTLSVATEFADSAGGDTKEVLTLRGANGLVVEAEITGNISPATQVGGQTLRALLNIPVEEPQVLVYRVTAETKANNQGVCGADSAAYVVVWEPSGPGDPQLKVLGVAGAAPGAGGARACTLLEFRRA